MPYTFHNRDVVLEFSGNCGQATVLAQSGGEALSRVQEIFGHMREESVRPGLAGEFLVTFKVALNYRSQLFHAIDRAVRRIRSPQLYQQARYLDRYILAAIAQSRRSPDYLLQLDLDEELESLRKAAIVAREVAGVLQFVDWDIVIANYIELNSKTGHKSRIVRTRQAKPSGSGRKLPARREATASKRLKRATRRNV